jgi:uncharacterized protein
MRLRSRSASWLATLTATLCCGAGLALAADPPPLVPAIVSAPTGEHHPGKLVWADLVTPDVAAAERFYGGLLGWSFSDLHFRSVPYVIAMLDGAPVAGIVQRPMPGERRQTAWLPFFAVASADQAGHSATAAGGKLLSGPHEYRGRGVQAVLLDPQGAAFAVVQSSAGDPEDALVPEGGWIWCSLITSDARADASFYQALFGYQLYDATESGDEGEHLILASDDFARVSVNSAPGEPGRRHPHWLPFVRVPDTRAAVSKAAGLGGRVLVEPHQDRHGGYSAVISDPTGAPLGLLEWTPAQGMEATGTTEGTP